MVIQANKPKTRRSKTMALEKENLEAHVDLCAERYQRLEEKYQQLQDTIDKSNTVIHERISKMKVNPSHSRENRSCWMRQTTTLITVTTCLSGALPWFAQRTLKLEGACLQENYLYLSKCVGNKVLTINSTILL